MGLSKLSSDQFKVNILIKENFAIKNELKEKTTVGRWIRTIPKYVCTLADLNT
jgi:hypothetical protein